MILILKHGPLLIFYARVINIFINLPFIIAFLFSFGALIYIPEFITFTQTYINTRVSTFSRACILGTVVLTVYNKCVSFWNA